MWPLEHMYIPEEILPAQMRTGLQEYMAARMICELEKAAQEEGGDEKLTALDWFNGRRYPCLNETVKSSISGLSLGTAAPDIYRALVKGTIFGSRHIYDSLVEAGEAWRKNPDISCRCCQMCWTFRSWYPRKNKAAPEARASLRR